MSLLLAHDLHSIQRELLTLGSLVEQATQKAIFALINRLPDRAREVLADSSRIDDLEVAIEEASLKVLALRQPVATDLRQLVMVLKVNNDLERMGDLAANIAERALALSEREPLEQPLAFAEMVRIVTGTLHDSLDALVDLDTDLARAVCARDQQVDALYRRMYIVLQDLMKRDSNAVERAVQLLSASRHLERIGDLATNIAEDVIFMVEGEVVRHQRIEESRDAQG